MGVPTTTTAPQNVYYVIDDYGNSNTSGGGTGAGSGFPISSEFTAPSLATATTVAYLIASALQRPVRLVNKYASEPPWTLVTGAVAQIALTSVPSGIGY